VAKPLGHSRVWNPKCRHYRCVTDIDGPISAYVAWIKRSGIREDWSQDPPHYVAVHGAKVSGRIRPIRTRVRNTLCGGPMAYRPAMASKAARPCR